MPFPSLGKTTQRRAITQAAANTESNQATVTKTYTDALGNVTAADVKVKGQVAPLTQVANVSGLKLYVGGMVEVRFLNGSAHNRQITGSVGGGAAAALSAAASAPAPLDMASYLAGNAPVLLQAADAADNPNGYVEAPGANVSFTDAAPSTGSGGQAVNGQRLVSVRPLVATSLPNAQATTLPDGTLLDLVDSYGNPLGMFRLDAGGQVWRRRDAGSGGGAVLLPATATVLGGVKIGPGISVATDGTISVPPAFAAAPPLVPTGISQIISYNGSTMFIAAVPAFYSSADPALSVPYTFWQKSMDGGNTWFGHDNTASTTFPGVPLQSQLDAPASGAAAPTLRLRARTENASGAVSDWFTQTADTVYAPPPFDAAGAAASAQAASLQKSASLGDLTNAAAARTNLGLGTAAQADLPAGGSNASLAQVVRGDDTRLGTASFAGSASPALGLLQVAPGYQVAPGNAGFSPAFLLSDKSSGDATSGYQGVALAAAKPASPTLQSGNAITSGIIAAYPFAENAGTTVHDISGNALHMAFGGTSPTWATGPNGTVLSFGGSGSINCAATSLLQPAGSFTLSAFINASPSQPGGSPRWWRQGNTNGGYFGLAGSGNIVMHTASGTYNSTFSTASYEGAYHLYTVVLNTAANTLTYYVDGTVIGISTTATGNPAWDSGATQYLMGSPNSDYAAGQMDVAYEWGRALSGSEIAALAANPYQLIGTTTGGNAITALLDVGPLGFLPVTTLKWTRTWNQQLSEVLEYSSNGTAWTAIPTGYTPANNGGTATSLQTTVTLTSAITARYLRYSAKDVGSSGQVLLTDFGVS